MNKRKMSLLLAAALVVTGLPSGTVQAKEAASEVIEEDADTVTAGSTRTDRTDTVTAGSTGTDRTETAGMETVEIRDAQEFISFAQNCHLDAWSYNKKVELKKDIDLSGEEFEPIPVFDGIFKGNGHTISDFRHTGDGYAVGLFRYVGKNGRIENLTVEGNVSSTDEEKCVGGLCGNNEGIISGCKFKGTVSGKTETGGIAGINQGSGVIENCVTEGRITGYYYTGGTAGKNYGNISGCINHANINDSSAWVEEDDQSGGFDWLKSVSSGETAKIQSGVDTGGIAGYSDGVLLSCSNTGVIGYEHTGYNIGGIAGRQAGLLLSGTNKGTVYGRKDVGGIVGQMEPYIRLNQAGSVEEEVQKLHDLIDRTLDDMGAAKDTLGTDCDALINYSDGALNRSHTMVSQMSGFVDGNVGAVNQMGDRLEYVLGRLPFVLDPVSDSFDGIAAVTEDIRKLNEDLHVIGQMEINGYDETDYRRLSLITGQGGELSADNNDPAEGAAVSLTVRTDNGYAVKTISARDAAGNTVELNPGGNGSYGFTMPRENVAVTAEFAYRGSYLTSSSAGGQLSVSENNDSITVTAVPFAGYEWTGLSIGGEEVPLNGGAAVTVNRSDYPAEGIPVLAYARFQRDSYEGNGDGALTVQCVGGTGGSVVSDSREAEEGSEVHIVCTHLPGYQLKKLSVRSGEREIAAAGSGENTFTFSMPGEDVVVEAQYEPLRFCMESNAGGSASYSYKAGTVSGNTVSFTALPDEGYTLSGEPSVTGGDGSSIPVSRVNANSFAYEFGITKEREPAKAVLTFEKQNQYTSIQSALDSIGARAEELSGAMNRISSLTGEIRSILTNSDGSGKDLSSLTALEKETLINDVIELSEQLTTAGRAASSILGSVSLIANITQPYLSQTAESTHEDIKQTILHVQQAVSSLSAAGDGVKSIVNYLNGQQNINFTQLGGDFSRNVDDLYTQLQGISDSMKSLNSDTDQHADVLTEDFRAVNDQLNVVLLLFLDRMDELENPHMKTIYEDISDEDIEESTQGKVSRCINKGVVQGDINVGGVAGSLSIDEEDPEENAAGSVEISLGSTYLTKCIVDDCKNYGYVTAKKDGAGCIAGYMNLGVASGCEAYGGAESTEGDYVGGICGQSLAMIQKCYSLCTLSGGKYVGGIAGYGDAVKNCYAMAEVQSGSGRAGAIAGQAASREDDELLENMTDNYYVGDAIYGIDDISYVGVAEPITYQELLTVENLPVDYRHLKVTFMADGKFVGTEEMKYGESLSSLHIPDLADIGNTNGIWPDVSGRTMQGNLVLAADYEENIAVLESEEQQMLSEEGSRPLCKALAFAEGEFTGKAVLHVIKNELDIPPHSVTGGKDYTVYDITLENGGGNQKQPIPLRLLNTGGADTEVWRQTGDGWEKTDTNIRGQYLQLTMEENPQTFCLVSPSPAGLRTWLAAGGGALLAIVLLLLAVKKRKAGKTGKIRKIRKAEKTGKSGGK